MHFFGCYSLSYKVFVLGGSQAIWPALHGEYVSPPLSLASLTGVFVRWVGGLIEETVFGRKCLRCGSKSL